MTSPASKPANQPTRTARSTAAKAATAKPVAAKPAPEPKAVEKETPKAAPVKKASAQWHDTANRPATANEQARYEWTCQQAGLKAADFPIALFLLGARNQKFYQEAHRAS